MKLTITIMIICIAVFLLEIFSFPLIGLTTDQFFEEFGFSTQNSLAKPWTIVTSIFMHGDLMHILSNMIVLLFFGFALEDEIGWKKTFAIFMLSAFAGQAVSVLYYAPNIISIGASAGIFGLIGTGILLTPFSFKFPNPIPLGVIGIAYAFYNIIGFFSGPSEISYIAHFGGLLIGLAFGFYYKGLKKGIVLIAILSAIFIALLITIPIIIKLLFG